MGYDVKKLWKGNRLQIRYPVIYGGDGIRPSGEPFVLGVQGALGYKQKPQCVHISTVHADLLPTDVYSGMYARVTVNRQPRCRLWSCKTRDGEPLGSRASGNRSVRRHWCPSLVWTRISAIVWLRCGEEWVLHLVRGRNLHTLPRMRELHQTAVVGTGRL